MRSLNAKECESISGGAGTGIKYINGPSPIDAPTLAPVISIGYPLPEFPTSGLNDNSGTGGNLGGGGGEGGNTVPPVRIVKELLVGIMKELEALEFDGVIPSDLIQQGVDIGSLSATALQANLSAGRQSWQMYQDTGFSPNGDAYINYPIEWQNVDWSQFAQGATTFPQALEDMYNYYNRK